jgi:hypothetical protein
MERRLRELAAREPLSRTFATWCALGALTLSNAVDPQAYQAREAEYMQLIKAYSREELDGFCALLGSLITAMDAEPFSDLLGALYTHLELHHRHASLYITPESLAGLMAQIMVPGMLQSIIDHGYVAFNEPCCGSGVMILAVARAMVAEGYTLHQDLHVIATDVNRLAVHMCYIQCTLHGIPAVIHHGDSLTGETWETWRTFAHQMAGWEARLASPNTSAHERKANESPYDL